MRVLISTGLGTGAGTGAEGRIQTAVAVHSTRAYLRADARARRGEATQSTHTHRAHAQYSNERRRQIARGLLFVRCARPAAPSVRIAWRCVVRACCGCVWGGECAGVRALPKRAQAQAGAVGYPAGAGRRRWGRRLTRMHCELYCVRLSVLFIGFVFRGVYCIALRAYTGRRCAPSPPCFRHPRSRTCPGRAA